MNCTEYLVTLNIPPSLEEMMVDSLLMLETEHGFSSFPVNAHHHDNKGLSLAEQVTGRQKTNPLPDVCAGRGIAGIIGAITPGFFRFGHSILGFAGD